MHEVVCSEDLGGGIVAELRPEQGTLTLLDKERGVELSAIQALNLSGFLAQHDIEILTFALEYALEQPGEQ